MGDPHLTLAEVIDEEAISPLPWRWLFTFLLLMFMFKNQDGDVDSDLESVLTRSQVDVAIGWYCW